MLMKVRKEYDSLLKRFGPQNWWPAGTKYEVVVGAILTQNTSWKNVERALSSLRIKKALNEKRMLEIPLKELEQLVHPSGYYRQKAERLKLATRKWTELKNSAEDTMELRRKWLSVKGIGPETADTILLYAMDRPVFVVDAYTRKFCKAVLGVELKNYEDYRLYFQKRLPVDLKLYREYHALIVEWGKAVRNQAGP
ncbi:endonuclease [Candidatus Micrarchaeota archaeon]|nr:endonuclease [Candidatus Micrarchaeota archaeon]